MFNLIQAQTNLVKFYPQATIKVWTPYQNLYLFRVEHPSVEEKDYDPFFSVDKDTGEVRDFSVLTDISMPDFMKLEWKEV